MSVMRGAWQGRSVGVCLLLTLAICWLGFGSGCEPTQSFAPTQSTLVPATRKSAADPPAPLPPLQDALLIRSHTPGAALAWIIDGELDAVHYAGSSKAGSASAGTSSAVNSETLFLAGSLGEPILAMLVMQMVEAGQFDLDLPIGIWLEAFPGVVDPRIEELTARQILTHTSGLSGSAERPLELVRTPGQAFHYAGSGFDLLQAVLEAITGRSFSELAQERIFRPLGMSHTRFVWDESFATHAATGLDRKRRPATRRWRASPRPRSRAC